MNPRNNLRGKHTATYRGKMVRVHCRDGSSLVGRFLQRTANKRILLTTGAVEMKNVYRLEVLKKKVGQ